MADGNEYAAVPQDDAQLLVKEGEEIDYSIVLGFYLIADLRYEATEPKARPLLITLCFTVCVLLFVFARDDGYWVVPTPFLPLTFWMGYKVYKQRSAPKAKTE